MRRILHHEKGETVLDPKIENAHNMRVYETSHGTSLGEEVFTALARQVGMQHLNGGLCAQVQVFAQIDAGLASAPDQTEQAIVPELLAYAVTHLPPPHEQ